MCEINSSRGLWPSRLRGARLNPSLEDETFFFKRPGAGPGAGPGDRLTTVTYHDDFISDASVSSNDPPTHTHTPKVSLSVLH